MEDSLGNIYLTDDNNELRWFTLAGEAITIEPNDQISKVEGIATSPSDEI